MPFMPTRVKFALLAVLLLAWCSSAWAEKIADIRPEGYVTDLAHVIDPATKAKLEVLCAEVEQKTGAQIAVVTVDSLDGRSKEDYAADLYKHLGVGSKKENRGVLLLVAPKERQYRIEVGYGLEPVINDARAGDIGREMVPDLRREDYSAAVLLGTTRIAQLIAADKGVQLNGVPANGAERACTGNAVVDPVADHRDHFRRHPRYLALGARQRSRSTVGRWRRIRSPLVSAGQCPGGPRR